MNNTAITPYLFGETAVRTTIIDEVPLVCGKDACDALGIENSRDAMTRIPDDEKITVGLTDGNPRDGIPHQLTYVTEPGLYRLIFRSRKSEAAKFQRWVFHEVLPTIRRTGSYGPRSREVVALARELLGMGFALKEAAKLVVTALPPLGVRESAALAAEVKSGPSAPGCYDEDLELLGRMDGTWQRVEPLAKVLPLGRLRKKQDTARQTAVRIGKAMARLMRAGLVEKNPDDTRHSSWRPITAEDAGKVVPMG